MINLGTVGIVVATVAIAGSTRPALPVQDGTSAPAGCASPAQPVHEEQFVRIGGIEQWITINGESCANPVILFLHGGPGNTLSPYAGPLFGSWQKDFTLVQWDQRGAGKTYGRNPPAPGSTLTVERMTKDGLAVAEHLTRRLGTAKILLVGGSWGSILGIHMAKARPDLFHAYVGFAQVVSYAENQTASYEKTTAAARAAGDQTAIASLEALGNPPWTNPRNYGILRRATRAYEAKTTDSAPKSWWVRAPEYDTPEVREHDSEGEDFSYLQFVGLEGNGMLSRVDLPALGSDFQVPVFMAQGSEDLVTVPEAAQRYFDRISAPEKQFVLVPRAGHDPNAAMLDALYRFISRYKRRQSPAAGVLPGIEVFLSDVPRALRGKRVGLITNHTGIDRNRTPDIDLIARHKDLTLVALLAPEHGIRGDAQDGVTIVDEVDAKTGVPVYSLYLAEDRGPTPAMLKDVDVLVYDLQEVGGRTWTYVSTMALSMQAAAKKKIPFVVLDRPNPIGGEIVEGALLDPKFTSFVGMYPIPARHGMTVGELATLFNQKYGIGVELIVARVANWRRAQWFDETGLPWVNPSPNLRSLSALTSYPGSVYFEGTSVTEGRGTDRPFEQVGAAWLNAPEVVRVMNEKGLPGTRFEAITMTVAPTAAKFKGQTIPAIRFAITDRLAYRPVRTSLLLIDEIRRRHPREFAWTATIDRLTGSDRVRLAIEGGRLPALLDEWDREAAEFHESRAPYLLYR